MMGIIISEYVFWFPIDFNPYNADDISLTW